MAEYQLLKDYAELGQNLGYTGEELKQFVAELHKQERQRRVEEREEDKARREDEERMLQVKLEIEKAKLALAESCGNVPAPVTAAKPKLPKYDESLDSVDIYLDRFERFASANQWPKEEWANLLSPLLTGKALQAYVSLTIDDAKDYEAVKVAILHRYQLTEEGYRL